MGSGSFFGQRTAGFHEVDECLSVSSKVGRQEGTKRHMMQA